MKDNDITVQELVDRLLQVNDKSKKFRIRATFGDTHFFEENDRELSYIKKLPVIEE